MIACSPKNIRILFYRARRNKANKRDPMIKKIYILFLVAFLAACTNKYTIDANLVRDAERAINLCVSEYTRVSGKEFFDEVDRAYVEVVPAQFGIVFTHGEMGTFGRYSEDYENHLTCLIVISGAMKIYFLGDPLGHSLINLPSFDSLSGEFNDENASEMLYKRDGDRFVFVAIQKMNVEPDYGDLLPKVDPVHGQKTR